MITASSGVSPCQLSGDSREDETDGANGVAFSSACQQVAAALSFQDEPIAVIWDLESGKRLQTLRGPKPPADNVCHEFQCLSFSPDGKRIVCGSSEEMAVLFEIATGRILQVFPSSSSPVLSVAASPDGSKLTGTDESKAILWDLNSGNPVRTFDCATGEYVSYVSSVAFSPDGRQALASSGARTFLFDVDSGATSRIFDSGDDDTYAATYSPNGCHVLVGGIRDWWDKEAVLWEVATGKQIQVFRGPRDVVRSVAFSTNGQTLTVG